MSNDLLVRLKNMDSCAVSDAMDSLGLFGEVTGINNQTTKDKIVGRTLTVELGNEKPAGAAQNIYVQVQSNVGMLEM